MNNQTVLKLAKNVRTIEWRLSRLDPRQVERVFQVAADTWTQDNTTPLEHAFLEALDQVQ